MTPHRLDPASWSPPGKPGAPLPSSCHSLRSLRTTPRGVSGDILRPSAPAQDSALSEVEGLSEAPPATAGARSEGSQPRRGSTVPCDEAWALQRGQARGRPRVVRQHLLQGPARPGPGWRRSPPTGSNEVGGSRRRVSDGSRTVTCGVPSRVAQACQFHAGGFPGARRADPASGYGPA